MRSPLTVVAVSLIKLYRATLGTILGGSCRYHPSCSEYALQAVTRNGALIGSAQALGRIVRCGPWSKGGVDYPKPSRRAARVLAADHRTEAARG